MREIIERAVRQEFSHNPTLDEETLAIRSCSRAVREVLGMVADRAVHVFDGQEAGVYVIDADYHLHKSARCANLGGACLLRALAAELDK